MICHKIELRRKYVFHLPLYRYENDNLIALKIDDLLDDLTDEFIKSGFENFYVTEAKAHYRKRSFDELLITMFADSASPEMIFKEWFRENNDVLGQEAFAWECGNSLFIEKL